jgi:hypothetical protein
MHDYMLDAPALSTRLMGYSDGVFWGYAVMNTVCYFMYCEGWKLQRVQEGAGNA